MGTEGDRYLRPPKASRKTIFTKTGKRGQAPPSPVDKIHGVIVITKDSKTLKRLNILNSKWLY